MAKACVTVSGCSMHPTLLDGYSYLADTEFTIEEGSIYMYVKPLDGEYVVKRLHKYYPETGMCYFLGDNAPSSIDSRNYGLINKDSIVAKLHKDLIKIKR